MTYSPAQEFMNLIKQEVLDSEDGNEEILCVESEMPNQYKPVSKLAKNMFMRRVGSLRV